MSVHVGHCLPQTFQKLVACFVHINSSSSLLLFLPPKIIHHLAHTKENTPQPISCQSDFVFQAPICCRRRRHPTEPGLSCCCCCCYSIHCCRTRTPHSRYNTKLMITSELQQCPGRAVPCLLFGFFIWCWKTTYNVSMSRAMTMVGSVPYINILHTPFLLRLSIQVLWFYY